jgi:HAD superfamily hydrolase (TIGR01459 family)
MAATAAPPLVRLSEVAERYDAIFSDVWGVVHNGLRATPSACEALVRFRATGKPVIMVSNAPRPASAVAGMLDRLGVPRDAYDEILTSGDLTRAYVAADPWSWVHFVGPERDRSIFDGLDATFCDPDEADFAVFTGLVDDDVETPEAYRALLDTYLEHDVPFICANPDIVVERGNRLVFCAGAVAELYKAMGGAVTYFGKPHAEVYAEAQSRLAARVGRDLEPQRMLAIGDSVRTDLVGARDAGFDALFLAGGIHANESGSPDALASAHLAHLFRAARVAPIGLAWHLVW